MKGRKKYPRPSGINVVEQLQVVSNGTMRPCAKDSFDRWICGACLVGFVAFKMGARCSKCKAVVSFVFRIGSVDFGFI